MFKALGALGDINALMKQAQEVQTKMQEAQEAVGRLAVEGQAGAGLARAVANGHGKLVSVAVDPSLLAENDPEILQDLIVAAVNDAQEKAAEAAQAHMAEIGAGMPMPPGFKL